MREIGSDTGSVDYIVESELVDVRASLEQKRERLQSVSKLRVSNDKLTESKGVKNIPGQYHQRRRQQLERNVSFNSVHLGLKFVWRFHSSMAQ